MSASSSVESFQRFVRGVTDPPVLLGLLGAAVVVANAPSRGTILPLALGTGLLLLLCAGWGRLLARTVRTPIGPEAALILGAAFAGHLVALPVLFAGAPLLVGAALLPFGAAGLWPRRGAPGAPAGYSLTSLAAAGYALLWSLDSTRRYEGFVAGGPMRLWLDVFIHAGTIAELGDPRTTAQGSSALAGVPTILYHAVSHAFPALAVRLAGVGPLDSIAAVWLPLGAYLTSLGVAALGRALAGSAGAALAILLFVAVPDAASLGLRNGFLSFNWMMETSPGGLYALPVAVTGLVLLVEWSRRGRSDAAMHKGTARDDRPPRTTPAGGLSFRGVAFGGLPLGILALALTFLLRAHVFLWAAVPAGLLVWIGRSWMPRRLAWAGVALGGLALPVILIALSRAEVARVGTRAFLTGYLVLLHQAEGPTAYDGLYPWLSARLGDYGAVPLGLLLALTGMGGPWLLTWGAGFVLAARRGRLASEDAIPPALLAWACLLMLSAPTPFHGDVSDLRQRGFVLVPVVLIAWTARDIVRLLASLARPRPLAVAAVLALGLTALWLPGAKAPRMAFAVPYVSYQPRPGLRDVAAYIGREAHAGESFLLADQRAGEFVFDEPSVIAGIAGVPSYLSRSGLMRAGGPPRSTAADERLKFLASLAGLRDPAQAFALLADRGIAFYVASLNARPAWDPTGVLAARRMGDFVVWRTGAKVTKEE